MRIPFCRFLDDRVSTPGFGSESPQLLLHHAEELHLSDQQPKRSITGGSWWAGQSGCAFPCPALPFLTSPCLALCVALLYVLPHQIMIAECVLSSDTAARTDVLIDVPELVCCTRYGGKLEHSFVCVEFRNLSR